MELFEQPAPQSTQTISSEAGPERVPEVGTKESYQILEGLMRALASNDQSLISSFSRNHPTVSDHEGKVAGFNVTLPGSVSDITFRIPLNGDVNDIKVIDLEGKVSTPNEEEIKILASGMKDWIAGEIESRMSASREEFMLAMEDLATVIHEKALPYTGKLGDPKIVPLNENYRVRVLEDGTFALDHRSNEDEKSYNEIRVSDVSLEEVQKLLPLVDRAIDEMSDSSLRMI